MGQGGRCADGSSFEDKVSTHGQPLSAAGADYAATVKNLGGDPENPFCIFSESAEVYGARREELRAIIAERKAEEHKWRSENKDLARKLDLFLSGEVPPIDYKNIDMKADSATRAASATMLSVFADKVENMIVASADLSNSDKTDGLPQEDQGLLEGRFLGQVLPGRSIGTHHGLHDERYGVAWRCYSGLRYVLRILRLHEAGRTSVGAHAPACDLHMDSRLVPCR